MSSVKPTKPYVYQPFGSVTNPMHDRAGRLWGVAGLKTIHPLIEGTLRGLTREEAHAVINALAPDREDGE